MKRVRVLISSLVLVSLGAVQVARGETYDAHDDFGDQQGSNGVWYYLEHTGTQYIPLTYHSGSHAGPYESWLGTEGDLDWLPAISKEYADVVYPGHDQTLFLHPGDHYSRYDVVLRWISPVSGYVVSNMLVQRTPSSVVVGGNGCDVCFDVNGSTVNTTYIQTQDLALHSFQWTGATSAGDYIDLRIYNRGNNESDSALVNWQIETVPLPGAFLLGGLRLSAAALKLRRYV